MSYAQVSTCPKCGAPIYAESPWWGINPPPSKYSCACYSGLAQYHVITTNTLPVDWPTQEDYDADEDSDGFDR